MKKIRDCRLRRPVGRVRREEEPRGEGEADRGVLPARALHRRAPRLDAARERRRGRPDEHGHVRPHRGHRPLRRLRGFQFKTYCTSRIRGAILDSLRTNDWVPRLVRLRVNLVDKTLRRLHADLGREPTAIEMSDTLGMSLEAYRAAARGGEPDLHALADRRVGRRHRGRQPDDRPGPRREGPRPAPRAAAPATSRTSSSSTSPRRSGRSSRCTTTRGSRCARSPRCCGSPSRASARSTRRCIKRLKELHDSKQGGPLRLEDARGRAPGAQAGAAGWAPATAL